MGFKTEGRYPEGLEVIRLTQCVSTNNYLRDNYSRLKDRLPVLVTAALQTGGRGRHQRGWVSTEGKGLYASFGFSIDSHSNLYLLPLIAAISAIETLEEISGSDKNLSDSVFSYLWDNFHSFSPSVQGDIIYITGETGDISCINRIQMILDGNYSIELKEAAEEAVLALNQNS